MTCAKVVVRAELRTQCGQVFHGENAVLNPQATCPREDGEGYMKCLEICNQVHHAESHAIAQATAAGVCVRGANMLVYHTHICSSCRELLDCHGINAVIVQPATGCDWRKMAVPAALLNKPDMSQSVTIPVRRRNTTRPRIKSGNI